MNQKVENLKGKLIVSCQALSNEPLHSSFIMGRMALAAKQGGASGIRANTKEDIKEIQSQVDLPIIGIVKRDYDDSDIYITPTMKEIDELMEAKPEIIALDATNRLRPGGVTLKEFYNAVRKKYPEQLLMADCSTLEEAVYAAAENAKENEQILCVNLKSGECRQVVKPGDGMNMSMSPDGKYILINHSKSYWTVFDTEKETEHLAGHCGFWRQRPFWEAPWRFGAALRTRRQRESGSV